jgi:hypothetical protein
MHSSPKMRRLPGKFVVFVCESRRAWHILVWFVAKRLVLTFVAIRPDLGAFLASRLAWRPCSAPSQ